MSRLIYLAIIMRFASKKIPADAFDSVVLGYDASEGHKMLIINSIQSSEDLRHLKVKQVKHDLYGDLELSDVVF